MAASGRFGRRPGQRPSSFPNHSQDRPHAHHRFSQLGVRPGPRSRVHSGERWQYSGEGFVFLQRVVEKVTGRPLDDHVNESVFGPLGMSSSSFLWRDRFEGHFATGHDRKGAPGRKARTVRALSAGSLHTTARDYGRFLEALLRPDGEGFALQSLARPLVEVDRDLGLSWGLGWGIADRGSERFAWHWGSNPGFQSFVMISLGERSGVLLLTNSENGLRLAGDIVGGFYPGEHPVFRFRMLQPR